MSFKEDFITYTEGYPSEVREQLTRLADNDALLSLQGITRVLSILQEQQSQPENSTELYRVDL